MPTGIIPASPGNTYSASGYVKAPAGTSLNFLIDEYNGSTYVALTNTAFVASGNWDRISVSRTVASGNTIRPVIRTPTSNASALVFNIDAVMVTNGSTLNSYADGDSNNWVWNGTANGSTSTGPPL
jgi:hypothetical protein